MPQDIDFAANGPGRNGTSGPTGARRLRPLGDHGDRAGSVIQQRLARRTQPHPTEPSTPARPHNQQTRLLRLVQHDLTNSPEQDLTGDPQLRMLLERRRYRLGEHRLAGLPGDGRTVGSGEASALHVNGEERDTS